MLNLRLSAESFNFWLKYDFVLQNQHFQLQFTNEINISCFFDIFIATYHLREVFTMYLLT